VIVLANAAGDGGTDVRTFWADLKRGLRRREPAGADAQDLEEPEPVDVSFDRFFAEAPQAGDGYLQLDDLADMLERTGERAGRLRERLPSGRGAGGDAASDASAAPGRVVVQDRVPATSPTSGSIPVRRSGHLPVRRVGGSAGTAGAVAAQTAAPPAVPPQRADH
jgi:hypothetical protein